MDAWVEHELDGAEFPDQQLKSRLGKTLVTWAKDRRYGADGVPGLGRDDCGLSILQ